MLRICLRFQNKASNFYRNSHRHYFNSAINHESFANGSSSSYLEDMYRLWQVDPKQVHASWDTYFRRVNFGSPIGSAYISPPILSQNIESNKTPSAAVSTSASPPSSSTVDEKTIKEYLELQSIIMSFRLRGHSAATLDPLNIIRGEHMKAKLMQNYVLRHYKLPTDMNKKYILHNTDFIGGGEKFLPISEILKRLETAYCGNIGIEYMHLEAQDKFNFIREHFETPGAISRSITSDEKNLILKRLVRAYNFEEYLSKKYPSEKRFGLEGGEVLIPAVKTMIDTASAKGVDVFNIGVAHRGRLNILANVVRKPLKDLFARFRTLEEDEQGSGDVKYHLGTYVERINSVTKRPVIVSVTANPSHLEAVNPVVVGKTFGERTMIGDIDGNKIWSILIHGDAATTGQGIVYETFHLSELPCFTNYGSIHIIINNQIGFTTDPRLSRSSEYCTEVAKVSNAPVFHVNADDPEAVCYVMKVATEFKLKFKTDVVIDLVCYRRNGHNEGDQPFFTQPLMYKVITGLKPVALKYTDTLLEQGVVTQEEVDEMNKYSADWLHEGFEEAQRMTQTKKEDWLDSPWKGFFKPSKDPLFQPKTGTTKEVLLKIGKAVSTVPQNFDLHPGLKRVLNSRKEMIAKNSVDWSLGESFAFGSLNEEGFNVRLTGQDVERGTFSHRHHVYHHQSQDKVYHKPMEGIFPDGGTYTVCNSSLSEFGVLGFELGFSMVSPNNLVIWEAQFGDFANSAQVMIDTFICCGEQKWGRQSGIVMQLPHGFEGQGPEHSSARPERYLQLCAELGPPYEEDFPQQMLKANWYVVNPTTPANLFHVLRRQLKLNYRKPLVIFTPKSLLRHPEAKSPLDDMIGDTTFKPYLKDDTILNPNQVEKVLFCCGKVYYELKEERQKRGMESRVALARVEQLFPLPYKEIREDMEQYPSAEIVWAQEEHKNQGWWGFMEPRLSSVLGRLVQYCGRPASAPTSTGLKLMHLKERQDFMDQCFK